MNPFEWKMAKPDVNGIYSNELDCIWDELSKRNTSILILAKKDSIVFEKYSNDWNAGKKHFIASMTKSVAGSLSFMLAMDEGLIYPDDYVCKYIPEWEGHPIKSQITIRHLATHTSGLEDASIEGKAYEELSGWKGEFWKRNENPFLIARDQVSVLFHPGTDYAYSNTGMAMLAYAITASLGDTPYKDIRSLLHDKIFRPMSIKDEDWSIGYDASYMTNGLNLVPNWGGGCLTGRALAAIGLLMLNHGKWEDKQIIAAKTVKETLRQSGTPAPHGLGWWVNSDLAGNKIWPMLPKDAFMAAGDGNQTLLVIPCRDLIVVRCGKYVTGCKSFSKQWEGFTEHIAEPLVNALEDPAPYEQSSYITNVSWAPASTITRFATGEEKRDGSDNWPITWGDDDILYTSYGDGYGFAPSLPTKLGLGYAKIEGTPADGIRGINIRSNGENSGYGGSGKKCSGLLMVNKVLYMWVRNADLKGEKSQLAWSDDYARTWTWSDWKFDELGHIVFVNYGRNYEGSKDHYVYMISHDSPSAYVDADRFVLVRVSADRINVKGEYEYFVRADKNNIPLWTSVFNDRGAVFTHKNRCRRSSVSYNPYIKRYILWQQVTSGFGSDTRFNGGIGVYEAPEPWGPWKTVYFSEYWDVGPGDLGCFPTKWMSYDSQSMYLVFAGDDNFSVRELSFKLR